MTISVKTEELVKGRSGRLTYILSNLVLLVIGVGQIFVKRQFVEFNFIYDLIFILIIIAAFILTLRRMHDINWSSWNILLIFIPILGIIVDIYLLLVPGNKGKNKYGEPEKGVLKF